MPVSLSPPSYLETRLLSLSLSLSVRSGLCWCCGGVIVTGTRVSAPPPSTAMWMAAPPGVSVDSVLTALWYWHWSGLTGSDREGYPPPCLLRYTRTYVLRSMLCFGIPSKSPAFRKFAWVCFPLIPRFDGNLYDMIVLSSDGTHKGIGIGLTYFAHSVR